MSECARHTWVVYKGNSELGVVMVQCVECLQMGVVESATGRSLSKARQANVSPYACRTPAKVTPTLVGPPHVIRRLHELPCDCGKEFETTTSFQRVPGGISLLDGPLTKVEIRLFGLFRDRVVGAGLCSRRFPASLRRFQSDKNKVLPDAVRIFAERVEKTYLEGGMHMSPAVLQFALGAVLSSSSRTVDGTESR